MNAVDPWGNFINLLGYCALAILILIIGLVLYGVLVYIKQSVQARRKRKAQRQPDKVAELQAFIDEATLAGMARYHNEPFAAEERVAAFRQGAHWAWHQRPIK